MNETSPPDEPDWTLWRSFEVVVSQGSLSAGARKLGLSQPTLGRHVDALEKALDLTLFERTLSGLKPTEAALQLYEPVIEAQKALAEARNRAEGRSERLEGTVRITASVVFSHYVLPPMLVELRQRYPAIALEIVATDASENLLLREADIAIRMIRPTQLELIARHLGDLAIACCAHEDYLRRRGCPQALEDLYDHDLIGLDRSELIIGAARELGFPLARDDFALRTDSQTLGWELIKAGLGVGFAQLGLIRAEVGMRRILPQMPLAPLPVWLTTHRELFTSRRIRVIYDALAEMIAARIAAARES